MTNKVYVRTCQECGHKQVAKDPTTYAESNRETWRDLKCKKCNSESLDFGSDGYELIDGVITRIDNDWN